MAQELIEMGRVRTWVQLGRAFGITGQAANQRFGKGTDKRAGYGLKMPPQRRYNRAVSVSLTEESDALVELIRRRTPGRRLPSRASVLRDIVERHLPDEAGISSPS